MRRSMRSCWRAESWLRTGQRGKEAQKLKSSEAQSPNSRPEANKREQPRSFEMNDLGCSLFVAPLRIIFPHFLRNTVPFQQRFDRFPLKEGIVGEQQLDSEFVGLTLVLADVEEGLLVQPETAEARMQPVMQLTFCVNRITTTRGDQLQAHRRQNVSRRARRG